MTLDGLAQMVEQNDEKAEAAHKRLRESVRDLTDTVESNYRYFEKTCLANQARIDQVERTPVDAAKLVLTPRVVALIVTTALTIAGGVWASTAGLRSDVRDILTRMDAQKTTAEASQKLQELQMSGLRSTVDDMKRRQELQQYEIQTLTKEVIGKGKRP